MDTPLGKWVTWGFRLLVATALTYALAWAGRTADHFERVESTAREALQKTVALETYRDDVRTRLDGIDRHLDRIDDKLDRLRPGVVVRWRRAQGPIPDDSLEPPLIFKKEQ